MIEQIGFSAYRDVANRAHPSASEAARSGHFPREPAIVRRGLLNPLSLLVFASALCLAACGEADRRWKEAYSVNTPQVYDQYLRDFPNADHAGEAIGKRQALRWALASQDNTAASFEQFLKDEAASPQAAEARSRLAKIEVGQIMALGDANERARRLVRLLGKSDYDEAVSAGVRAQLDAVASAEDLDPLVLTDDEAIGRYAGAFPDAPLSARIATAKEVRSRAGGAADKVGRVAGVVQAISPTMIAFTVKAGPSAPGAEKGLLPAGSKVAVERKPTSLMEYHVSVTRGRSRSDSIGHAINFRFSPIGLLRFGTGCKTMLLSG
jgi:hypothetical protein